MHELEQLTAPELEALLASGLDTAVVPFGSVEGHGGHLPLGADVMLAERVGRDVADRLDGVLAPTVRIGDAAAHLDVAGTLSVAGWTLTETAVDIGTGLARHGFRRIVFVSGHGGNARALRSAAYRLRPLVTVLAPDGDLGPAPGEHSGEWLTSVILALRPDLVRMERVPAELATEPQRADARRGAEHLERFVASIVDAATA